MELNRQFLNAGTVLVLIAAEIHGLVQLSADAPGTHQVWVENAALAWGFTTVAVLAFVGRGAPRVIGTLRTKPHTDTSVVVEAGGSNEYGDKDVAPVLNLLVPNGVSILACDANGNRSRERTLDLQILQTEENIAGVRSWNYPAERVLVSAGDATVRHFLLGGLLPGCRSPRAAV